MLRAVQEPNPLEQGQFYTIVQDPKKEGDLVSVGWGPDWPNASTVIPDVKSSDEAAGTVTQSFTPSKLSADPNRPDAFHAAPETEPTFPFPDESAALEPEPASNP